MSYGLSVLNDSFYTQIDSESPRLCALYRGDYAASGESTVRVTFPSPVRSDEPPCIFIQNSRAQPDVMYSGVTLTGESGNWVGFTLEANNVTWRPQGKWFCAVFAARAADTYGLRMWGDAGEIIYDSGSPPVIVTRADYRWDYAGRVNYPTLGGAYLYNSVLVKPMADDEYFMINPFSRGVLGKVFYTIPTGVKYDWAAQRVQMYIVTNAAGLTWTDIGHYACVYARLPVVR